MGFAKKLNSKKIVALAMAFAMVVGLVPTNALAVKAADQTEASGAVVTAGDWDGTEKTTTWDFSKYAGTSSLALATDDVVGGIKVVEGTGSVKNGGAGLSAQKKTSTVLGIPVDAATTAATLQIKFSSNNNDRYVTVGDVSGEKAIISLNTAGREELPTAVAIASDKTVEVTVKADAFVDGYLLLTPDTLKSGDSGEIKIASMTLIETKKEIAPAVGKTYTLDIAGMTGLTKQDSLAGVKTEDEVYEIVAGKWWDSSHGAKVENGDKITVKVAGNANLTFTPCQYSAADAKFVITDSTGAEVTSVAAKVDKDGETVKASYVGEATTLTITVAAAGSVYLHSIVTENLDAAGNAEDFTFIFEEKKDENGVVKAGEYKFGDSVLLLSGETADGVITDFTLQSGKSFTLDGKEYQTYKAGKRHADPNSIYGFPGIMPDTNLYKNQDITIQPEYYGFKAIKDGETVTGYEKIRETYGLGCLIGFTPAAKGMITVYYNSTSFLRVYEYGADGQRIGYVDAATNINSYSFEVVPGHKYVMSTTGKTNNMFYAGVSYVVDKKVTVATTVKNVDATVGSALKLSIVDTQLGGDAINLKQDATSVKLLNGHTYKIDTNDGGVKVLINGKDTFTVDGSAIEVTLNNVPDVELTGKIVGTDAANVSKIIFTGMTSGTSFEAVITGDTYKATLKPGEYNTTVVTTNGGFTKDRASVKADATNTNDVYVEVADPASYRELDYVAVGDLQKTGTVGVESGKAHVQGKAGDTLIVPVTGKGTITITTYYRTKLDVNGTVVELVKDVDEAYDTTNKTKDFTFDVDGDVTITFVETSYITKIVVAPDAAKVPFKSEIKVPGDYATLNDAVAAINNMADRPAGEAGRVTITLTADLQEQVNMTASYVTLKGEGHTISWYYGVGTKYYSVDPSTGLYNKRLAYDRYSSAEGNGNLWGGAFICRGNNFIAENTIFKNTYNYELTAAEKTDIAGTTLSASRLEDGADVTAYKYKERSNAFYVEADNIELYQCQILGSQDTFGRNGSANNNYHVYLKECVIGGNTDYICGEFSAVFDNCELQWKTFKDDASNNGKIGFIVAPKTSNYVFRDCKVTADAAHGEDPVLGKYGRTWGANSTATFINTETNGLIAGDGWGEMNTGDKTTAVFNEYNNTNKGEAFISTGATNTDKATVEKFIDTVTNSAVDTVLGSWTPVHYTSAAAPTSTPTATPAPIVPPTGDTLPYAAILVVLACVFGAVVILRRKFATK